MAVEDFYSMQNQQYSKSGIRDDVSRAKQIRSKRDAGVDILSAPTFEESQLANTISAINAQNDQQKAFDLQTEREAMYDNAVVAPLGMGDGNNIVVGKNTGSVPFDGTYIKTEDHNLGKGLYNAHTKKYGTKASRNNNPGNITGMSGNLLYGAVGMADSPHGDKGDRTQLVFNSPQEGFNAMHNLALKRYSGAPIGSAFSKWQTDQESFRGKLKDLNSAGINTGSKYSSLSPGQQKLFRQIWSRHEGYRGDYY